MKAPSIAPRMRTSSRSTGESSNTREERMTMMLKFKSEARHGIAKWSGIYGALALIAASTVVSGSSLADNVKIGWTSYPADLAVIADAIDGAKNAGKEIGVDVEFALAAGA